MTRSLNRSVVAGGVVYPAGTAAAPELEELITNPDFWSGVSEAKSAAATEAPDLSEPAPVKPRRPRKRAESSSEED